MRSEEPGERPNSAVSSKEEQARSRVIQLPRHTGEEQDLGAPPPAIPTTDFNRWAD